MFHVLDHEVVVYSGELSQSTQYVIDHYGQRFDDAIRSGILILYSDPAHCLESVRQNISGSRARLAWQLH
jgi:hypothetical protein